MRLFGHDHLSHDERRERVERGPEHTATCGRPQFVVHVCMVPTLILVH